MIDDFLSRLQNAGSEEERRWLALEFSLNSLMPGLREAVWAAAIPHWFDESFLAALLGVEGIARLEASGGLEELARLPFIEPFRGRGYNVHEHTRALLRSRLWKDEPDHFMELSRRAEGYCRGQDPEDTGWVIERIYHLLLIDPDEGADQLQSTGWRWQNSPNFAFDKVEAMARTARELIDEGMLNGRGRAWTLYWEGHLDAHYYRNQSALEKLAEIDLPVENDRYLAANRLSRLGDVELQQANYEAARARYEAARPIYAAIGDRLGEANTIRALGDLAGALEQDEVAIRLLEEAASIFRDLGLRRDEAFCFNSMAVLMSDLKRYKEDLGFNAQAITIYPDAMLYRNRADALIELERYDEAVKALETAEEMQPGQPYALFHRGRIALWTNHPADAVGLFEQAVAKRPLINSFHYWLAFALLAVGATDKALEALDRAIQLTYKRKELVDRKEELARLSPVYGSLAGLDRMAERLNQALEPPADPPAR